MVRPLSVKVEHTGQQSRGTTSAGWVLDASVTMPWFFSDEATAFTEMLLDRLSEQPVWAPALWVLECTNVLQSAQRRRRIDTSRRAEIAGELRDLPVSLDLQTPDFVQLDRLAAAHGLSAYDTAYLELAQRRSLVLVSLDVRLIAAAKAAGHPVLTAGESVEN
jgi:predicted nucleic acid-binding protein